MAQEITQLTINADSTLTSAKAELPPLGDDDVPIQVLFSGISKNDLLLI